MTLERFRQIENLYHAALARPPEERASVLNGADPELRSEVESLLRHDDAPAFIDRSPIEPLNVPHPAPGEQLGPYRIEKRIGGGGMGEVFEALDTRLNRKVAVKICQGRFGDRFENEAQAIAALNHPNICTLYDVGPNYLVMELLEGETLACRLRGGVIPIHEALAIADQIAQALEAAHEKGIVHRDLKPENVIITGSGVAKVLDFGLAKVIAEIPVSGASGQGFLIGTPGYMSPEQAQGGPIDKRTDIWAFGLVLFELLTGRKAFAGETVADTLAAVLTSEPDWNRLPSETQPSIRRLLRRTIARDRGRRLRDIADARLEINEALTGPQETPVSPPLNRWLISALAIVLLGFAALASAYFTKESRPEIAFNVPILSPDKTTFTPIGVETGGSSVSPDGRALAFVATTDGIPSLWVRSFDSMAARPLPETKNAHGPFWSPDSRLLGFFADDKLKIIRVSGGSPQVICDANLARGGAWSSAGVIVFSAFDRTIYRVPAAGGKPVKLTALDPGLQEFAHYWPVFLPDGRRFLYLSRTPNRGTNAVAVGSIDAAPGPAQRMELIKASSNALFVPGGNRSRGWLLFLRENTLYAHQFDASALQLQGEPVPVAERVEYLSAFGFGAFSASHNGVLVYASDTRLMTLAWSGRDGKLEFLPVQPGEYMLPKLAPDESRLAVSMIDASSGNPDLWQITLPNLVTTRFTFDPKPDYAPVWSPDGKQIAFSSLREGPQRLFVKPASSVGDEVRMSEASNSLEVAFDWSPDGHYILGAASPSGNLAYDLWLLPVNGDRKPTPFLQTEFSEIGGRFSPDGRWVVYASNESGRFEIYVRNFGGSPAKYQISAGGGLDPRWRGNELFYVSNDGKMMAAAVRAGPGSFHSETPRALFEAAWLRPDAALGSRYDAARDGQRFLVVAPLHSDRPQILTLVTNWMAGLEN